MSDVSSQSPKSPALIKQMLTSASVPVIVLDTNVVLDWLVFENPSVVALAAAIGRRQVRWVATAAMRAELVDVLNRGLAAARGADIALALRTWDDCVDTCVEPPAPPVATPLRCTDRDDQKFLDLALATRARWLLSRDRAVLRLSRRAAVRGTSIVVPEAWSLAP